MFNIVQFIGDLFGHKSSLSTPEQGVVNTAGTIIDDIAGGLDALEALAPNMPAPYKGLIAAAAVAFHNIDAYVDQFETHTSTGPTPSVTTTPS